MSPPKRIRTGIASKTVPFYNERVCDPKDFDFRRQKGNYQAISSILNRFHLRLSTIGVEYFDDRRPNRCRFVAFVGTPENPIFLWHKYESLADGSGHNCVYVDGAQVFTTELCRMSDDRIDNLMSNAILKAFVV